MLSDEAIELAIKNNCKLWTNDKHFKLIQIVKPELQIY